MSVPRTALPIEPEKRHWLLSRPAFLLYGLLLALAPALLLKPYWRDTPNGTAFGLGMVREPRVIRITSDIGDAIEAALPGDTVLVAPGVYDEPIPVRLKEGIRLVSEKPRQAIIRANSTAVTAEDVRYARIQGFKIQNDGSVYLQNGIQVLRSSIEIVDNEISDTLNACIELRESPGTVVMANTIRPRARIGLDLAGLDGPHIVGNTFITTDDAVAIMLGGNPNLYGNFIQSRFPIVAPPGVQIEELLKRNFVAPVERPRQAPRGRTAAAPDAPARVR
jgi:hypothetical protein